jgi:hypothetical protein
MKMHMQPTFALQKATNVDVAYYPLSEHPRKRLQNYRLLKKNCSVICSLDIMQSQMTLNLHLLRVMANHKTALS